MLDPVEVRVLGSLLEKEITTPEYYPLTLNALVNACNQKSNREPTTSYDEEQVLTALETLRSKKLSTKVTGTGLRVPKYTHRFSEALNLGRRETALLCVLMLRGQQTVGELRDRAERMHDFADLAEAESCLQRLAEREPYPLVTKLPRQPGMKEPRYAHLLSGEPEVQAQFSPEPRSSLEDRLSNMEAQVSLLRDEIENLKQLLGVV